MQIEGLIWPPRPEDYYRAADEHRPVTQGDVFSDVPFAKNKRASKLTDPPNTSYDRRLVAVLGYTCDLYTETGTIGKVQVVSPVMRAQQAGIPPDWDGAFNFAPLPDLLGDGETYAVDLRVSSNIDAFYLDPVNRVRCLSELGWASFRQRIGLSAMRVINHLEDLVAVGVDVWREVELWERWNRAGRNPDAFQAWLDERQATLGGFTRRELVCRGLAHEVSAALDQDLAAPVPVAAAPAAKSAPDVRASGFAEEAHRQSRAVAISSGAADDQAFVDTASSWPDE